MANAKFKKKEPIEGFNAWTKQVKKDKSAVFDKIYEHYSVLHDRETALKYAAQTFGKVLLAAGLADSLEKTYTVLKYEGSEFYIPNFYLDSWVKKADKIGLISLELHENQIDSFAKKYTDMPSLGLVFALDVLVAEKAGLEVNPEQPVTFRSSLIFKKDKVVFFSEKFGSQEIPFNLYYKWFTAFLSKGSLNTKTFSEMHKYAVKGKAQEPDRASLDFYVGYLKFVGSFFGEKSDKVVNNISKLYPEYFVGEMDKLLKKELEGLAELDLKLPKKEAGHIEKINLPGRIMVAVTGWDQGPVGLDADVYHLLYSGTVKNGGKAPSWANKKLYDFLTKAGYYEDDASKIAPLLVSFFEYQVAADSQAAKQMLETEKKLKTVPKK